MSQRKAKTLFWLWLMPLPVALVLGTSFGVTEKRQHTIWPVTTHHTFVLIWLVGFYICLAIAWLCILCGFGDKAGYGE